MKAEVLMVGSMIVLVALGMGVGWGIGTTVSPPAPVTTTTSTSTSQQAGNNTYSLTLIEVMQNTWNSSAPAQPKFFVLGSHGLEPAANISLPVHKLIQLTIRSYDTPTPNGTAQEAKVTGTVGGRMYLLNGTLATDVLAADVARIGTWGGNVSSVPVSSLAHTFTVPQLGINIPVVGGSMEVSYLYFDQPGTYTWLCLTPCGLGENGMSGAMDTAGWMMGSLMVG